MRPKYTINKVEGKHLVYENRLHLAREWNKQVKALSAKLSFRGFARMMHIPASTWRREYYAGGGTKPVRDLKNPNRLHFGEYDPDLAQRVANERAAQNRRSAGGAHSSRGDPRRPKGVGGDTARGRAERPRSGQGAPQAPPTQGNLAAGRPHFTVNVREQAENALQGLGRVRHYTCNSPGDDARTSRA